MFKLLKKYTQDGWWATLLGPFFTVLEVYVAARIPLVMSDIIDQGIYGLNGDMDYIWNKGLQMVELALLGVVFGASSGLFSSIASTRFIRNIRYAMFSKTQEYSFENIEKYPVPTVVMRLTTDMRMLRMAYVALARKEMRDRYKRNKGEEKHKIALAFNNSTKGDQQWLKSQQRKEEYERIYGKPYPEWRFLGRN